MNEKKYIGTINSLGRVTIHTRVEDHIYAETNLRDILALLNTPTPPPTGIVWRKPGEPGRVNGKVYLVCVEGDDVLTYLWEDGAPCDGWTSPNVIAWADLPSPPAWATGGAA